MIDKDAFKYDLPLIESEYRVVHFDEEPILYSGKNKYGNRVLGLLVGDDYEENLERSFHVIVTKKQYIDFILKKVTFLELMRHSVPIFIIDYNYVEDNTVIYDVEFQDIPESYLPSDESFCPSLDVESSLVYVAKLKGSLADESLANPWDISKINKTVADFIDSAFSVIKDFGSPKLVLEPCATGSFSLQYRVEFPRQQGHLFLSTEEYTVYIRDLIIYILNYMGDNMDNILNNDSDKDDSYKKLINKFKEISGGTGKGISNENRSVFNKKITLAAMRIEGLIETIGKNYKCLEISNKTDKYEIECGILDESSIKKIIEANNKANRIYYLREMMGEKIEYKMIIISLNTESGNGIAMVRYGIEKETYKKRRIRILSKEGLERSEYAESLYKGSEIIALGKVVRDIRRFQRIDVLEYIGKHEEEK